LLLNIITINGPEPNVIDILVKLFACAIMAVPILTLLILGIVSLCCRVPLSVGLTRGLRGCAVPIACVLLLGYAGLTIVTLRQEQVVDIGLQHIREHEGRYNAELQGKKWPGEVLR
jgi:hypothetical protein